MWRAICKCEVIINGFYCRSWWSIISISLFPEIVGYIEAPVFENHKAYIKLLFTGEHSDSEQVELLDQEMKPYYGQWINKFTDISMIYF